VLDRPPAAATDAAAFDIGESRGHPAARTGAVRPATHSMNKKMADDAPGAWLASIKDRAISRVYPARTIIINEGDAGDTLLVIQEGHGKIFSSNGAGKEIILATYGPGDTLGEPSLDGGTRSASVMTLEKTSCLIVKVDVVVELITKEPRLALHIIRNLIRLVRSSSENVKSLALEDVYCRVVRLLMKAAEPCDNGWIVQERLTQQAIADRVGSSREMVSRIFKDLERGGYLAVEDKHIAILKKPPPGW
jgi:CRP/FNR family transcriptional regulator, cyclic AMP receptor protein